MCFYLNRTSGALLHRSGSSLSKLVVFCWDVGILTVTAIFQLRTAFDAI